MSSNVYFTRLFMCHDHEAFPFSSIFFFYLIYNIFLCILTIGIGKKKTTNRWFVNLFWHIILFVRVCREFHEGTQYFIPASNKLIGNIIVFLRIAVTCNCWLFFCYRWNANWRIYHRVKILRIWNYYCNSFS